MAPQRLSIRLKLIVTSTVLLILAVILFSILTDRQGRKIIDNYSEKLTTSIVESLRRSGTAQIQLLAEASLIPYIQNDFPAIQSIIKNIAHNDKRVVMAAVVDDRNIVIAHSNPSFIRKRAQDFLLDLASHTETQGPRVVEIKGSRSFVFSAPVVHRNSPLCRVFLGYNLKPMDSELEKAQTLKAQVIGTSLKNTAIVGLLTILVGLLLAIFQGQRISSPIKTLANQANLIASGNLMARVDIKSRDEIGELGEQFNYMADRVMILLNEVRDKAVFEQELALASAVQATLIPDNKIIHINGMQLVGYFNPASQCGGDWWSYFTLPGNKLLILIGDVTGHGVASAMITAAAKGAASSILQGSSENLTLNQILKAMNAAIYYSSRQTFVMTCFASLFDPITKTMTFSNAGHNFPLFYASQTGEIEPLALRGNRLGDELKSEFITEQIDVSDNDFVVWYTDGIIDCENAKGERFGERRFRNLLKNLKDLSPEKARDVIIDQTQTFYGNVPQKDDITLVIGRISAPS